ncbi:cytochrome b/b6 domain-containing protein [Streptomyces sp. NPDC047002]|uniref:cytochrome b n=1 Tax=Streptomyces sp. NPDC047002 TaxID=3155475 RepID=UPI003454E1AE
MADAVPEAPATPRPARYDATARGLHWITAVLVVATLFAGIVMTGWLGGYHALLRVHEPLGAAVFVLAVARLANRALRRGPAFPAAMPRAERAVAAASECLMYGLLLVQPLAGWGMESAAGIPVLLPGGLRLPGLLPQDAGLYAALHTVHVVCGWTLFAVFVAHMSGVLVHALVVRDGLLRRMTLGRGGPRAPRG